MVGTVLAVSGGLLLMLVVLIQAYSAYMVSYYNRLAYAPTAQSAAGGTTDPSSALFVSPIDSSDVPSTTLGNPSVSVLEGQSQTSATPTPGPIKKPPATRITIPRIEVDSAVAEMGIQKDKNGKWAWAVPQNDVGHYENTANPGEIGNIAMAGHISIPQTRESKVFKRLPEVVPGDEVQVFNEYGQEFRYVVTGTRVVLPTEISVLDPTPDETLTLMTCVPDWIYSHRLIVTAKRIPPLPPDELD